MNPVAGWLYLIGTPQRARKLRLLIDRAQDAVLANGKIVEPALCPTRILFGEHESHRIYANEQLRPALDAWDTGSISKTEIVELCYLVDPMLRDDVRKAAIEWRKKKGLAANAQVPLGVLARLTGRKRLLKYNGPRYVETPPKVRVAA